MRKRAAEVKSTYLYGDNKRSKRLAWYKALGVKLSEGEDQTTATGEWICCAGELQYRSCSCEDVLK